MLQSQWQHASSENPQGGLQIMANGQHFSGTSFVLDGTDNRDPLLGIVVINPTLDSVAETKIMTSSYGAEFGEATGAVVSTTTKSGTNEFHGSAFWFRRTNFLRARNPFTQPPDRPLPDSKWNQSGAALGGPIARNRTFFFGNYQASRRSAGESLLLAVPAFPSPAARDRCFSGIECDLSLYPVPIFDPATGNTDGSGRVQFPGNIIPGTSLSPQAVALLHFIPPPNTGQSQDLVNNFLASGSARFNDDAFNLRIDHHLSEKLKLFGRYSFADFRWKAEPVFGEVAGGPGFSEDAFAGRSLARNQNLAVGFDRSLGPGWLTDFRFGWFRYRVRVRSTGVGTTPAADAGIPGINLGDEATSGMPAILISGFGDLVFGHGLAANRCNCPLDETEMQYQLVNNWTHTRGEHLLKFGGDFRFATNLRVSSGFPRSGFLLFLPAGTAAIDARGGGLGLATFLLGEPSLFDRTASSVSDAGERQRRWFLYGQDTWRVTSKLTFNFGLRWDVYFPESVNGARKGGLVDYTTGNIRVAGVGGIGLNGDVQNTVTNLGPRAGIAYAINQKTVVRLGYGRTFDIGTFGSLFGFTLTQNLPVVALQEITGLAIWQAAFQLSQGPPPEFGGSVTQTGLLRVPSGVVQTLRPLKMRVPTLDAWNVSLQRAITPTLSAEVAYVGNKGTHGFAGDQPGYDCNQATVRGFATGIPMASRRPFFSSFGWSQSLLCFFNDASSNYHSLQARVEKRFVRGLQFQTNYTWGKSLGYDADYYVIDPRVNYGPENFDRTHQVNLTAVLELPIGRGHRLGAGVSRTLNSFVGGWQLATFTTWLSGLPFTPTYRDCFADRDTGPCRPDLVGNPEAGGGRDRWFAVSTEPLATNGKVSGPWRRPEPGEFGNVGRNRLRGPGFFQADVSVSKGIRLNDSIRARLQADIFNLFNVVNLGLPDACVDCNIGGTAGKITSTSFFNNALQRQVQFALRFEF
jgi:outer membrane receptor protein involved in Fe transport